MHERRAPCRRKAEQPSGAVLSGVINAMGIPHVVLGGAVAELSSALLDPAREEIETRTLQAPWSFPIVEVLPDSASPDGSVRHSECWIHSWTTPPFLS